MKDKHTRFLDAILYLLIIGLLVFVGYLVFKEATVENILEKIGQYIGVLIPILLGVIGVIDFCFCNGLSWLVPSTYENYKNKSMEKQTKKYLKDFFCREEEFLFQNSNRRIAFLLEQLGLNRNQFERLKMAILDIKLMPIRSLEDAEKKMREIIKIDGIIITQDGKDAANLVYKEVKYFINFTDVLFIDDYYAQITDCLTYLIKSTVEEKRISFNRILVTHNGNFLLGIGVSQKMKIALIKATEDPVIFNNQSWIGHFSDNKKDKTIVVHDVLVSGKQIKESIHKVEKNAQVVAVFCIVNRLDHNGKNEIEKMGIPVYSLLELGDDDLEPIDK